MSISFFCQGCKSSVKMTQKKCGKCDTPIPRKGRKYRVHVRVNGKQKTRIVDTLEIAREVENKFKSAAIRGELDIKKITQAIPLQEFWDKKYLPWLKANKKSWYVDMCNFNKHIGPALGTKGLDRIAPFDIERFVLILKKKKGQKGKPLSPTTIKHQLVLLTRIFNVAIQWGDHNGVNPCDRVKKPKLNNQINAFLAEREVSRLLDVLSTWPDKIPVSIVAFCLYTGFRRGEIFKLTWDDVDLERQIAVLRDPKGILDQTLPLSDKAIEVLLHVPRDFDTTFIFYSTKGKQRKTIRHSWMKIKEAAGLPPDFRFHDLRHHFASSLVSNGIDLYTVQKLLSHKDASTTQRYAHLADKTLRDAVNLSDQLQTQTRTAEIIELNTRKGNR